MILSLLSEEQRRRFETELELDFAYSIPGLSRFRANVFQQRNSMAAVFRMIPLQVPTLEDLGLPKVCAQLAERRTGVKTHTEEKVVGLTDENLRAYPFLYLTGHGTVRLALEEIEALRNHLSAGGFLYADDNYGMNTSFRELLRQVFPEETLTPLPNSHPIYHVFYDLPGLPKIHEHDGKVPQGLGITLGERLVVFYSYESDIGDGLEDERVHNDPPDKRELAMQMAVNILMYAITQNALP